MQTDKELIEDAALSCGLPECGWMGPSFMYVKDNTFTDWNPLTNNSDALQLLNDLELDIRHANGKVHVGLGGEFWCTEHWFPNGNKDSATRRAIVRAAVAMLNRST